MAEILIIDDEEQILKSLKSALDRRDHSVVTARTLSEGRRFAAADFDVIFLDILLPDGNGLDLLDEILKRNRNQTVVMISGHADINTAVKAIRQGAYDFIEKPISLDRVLVTIDNATTTRNLRSERERLASIVYGDLLGDSAPIRQLRTEVEMSAPKANRFLITGENGTGKELVANLIHRRGQFADGPFVAINCAALPRELVESELFGHTAGAFTGAGKARKGKFQEANGGTLFLDEISEMDLSAQAKLLRAVETRTITPVGSEKNVTVDGNIVAASNQDLGERVKQGKFRQDLLYRLNVVAYHVPALRDRREDIPLLATHFLNRSSSEHDVRGVTLSPEAGELLKQHDYPGNVRELRNLMERLSIYCTSSTIEAENIAAILPSAPKTEQNTLKAAVDQFELEFIRAAIDRHQGNISAAARELEIERSLLYKKLRRLEDSTGA